MSYLVRKAGNAGCKHRNMTRGHKCDYRKQISEEKLDRAVAEVLRKLVSNKKFAGMMREKIGMEVDTTTLDQEIASYEKTLRQCYSNKDAIFQILIILIMMISTTKEENQI